MKSSTINRHSNFHTFDLIEYRWFKVIFINNIYAVIQCSASQQVSPNGVKTIVASMISSTRMCLTGRSLPCSGVRYCSRTMSLSFSDYIFPARLMAYITRAITIGPTLPITLSWQIFKYRTISIISSINLRQYSTMMLPKSTRISRWNK